MYRDAVSPRAGGRVNPRLGASAATKPRAAGGRVNPRLGASATKSACADSDEGERSPLAGSDLL